MGTVTIKAKALEAFVADIFASAGCSKEEGGRIGRYLVSANPRNPRINNMGLMQTPAAHGRVFNLGSDVPVTIRALAELVVSLIDPTIPIEHVSYERAFDASFEDIRCRVPDLTRVRQMVDYRPRFTLEDIVREVIACKRGEPVPRET